MEQNPRKGTKRLLIIKTGSTLPMLKTKMGDFEDYILRQLPGIPDYLVAPVTEKLWLPAYDGLSGVVITGSHAMVTDREEWSEFTAEWLRKIPEGSLPVLGICYGHQLLAHAMGGEVGYHPHGVEIGTTEVELTADGCLDPLLGVLPKEFSAHVAHAQTVLKLPPGSTLLARNEFEPHHAFVLNKNLWGVQFHPEFTVEIERAYIEEAARELSGPDLAAISASVLDHPFGGRLLQRFWELTRSRGQE